MMKKEKVTYVTYDQETHSLNRMLNNAGQKYQMYIYSSTFKPLVVNKIRKCNKICNNNFGRTLCNKCYIGFHCNNCCMILENTVGVKTITVF